MTRISTILRALALAACLLPACLESNPQPSPGGGHDAAEPMADTGKPAPGVDASGPGGDTVGGEDVSLPDLPADGSAPPEDTVEADATDIVSDLFDVVPDISDILIDLLDGGDVCIPDCAGPDGPKECGDDGCGGSCGVCINNCDPCGMGGPYEDPGLCMPDGVCAQVCCPLCCDGLECGDDGCGGACGMCGDGEVCVQNHCEPSGGNCEDPVEYPDCKSDLLEEACADAGGNYGSFGMSPASFCLCPAGDAGCPCDSGDDCVGICFAPIDGDCQVLTEGTCSKSVTIFGCFCIFEQEGEAWGICID